MTLGKYRRNGRVGWQIAALLLGALSAAACENSDADCAADSCAASGNAGQSETTEETAGGGAANGRGGTGSGRAGTTARESAGESGATMTADGGATAGDSNEAAGSGPTEAGAPGTARCQTNAECKDTLGCNGSERCVDGQCEAGPALSCPTGLQCTEHGAGNASCDYATPGRWLTYLGSETGLFPFGLRAVRLANDAAEGPSISLSGGVVDDVYQMIGVDSWSPNGQHLIVTNPKDIAHMGTNRLFFVEFGAGQPSKPLPLKGIPVGESMLSGPWAPDSSALFVQGLEAPARTYLVHFEPSGVRTELLFSEDEELSSLSFCADSRWFSRSVDGQTTLIDSQNPQQVHKVWEGSAYHSPDGRWLLQDQDSLLVAPCAANPKPIQVSAQPSEDGADWTSDSRFLIVTEAKRGLEVFDSTQQFKSVFKGVADSYLKAGSKLLLLGAPNAADEQQLTVVDLGVSPPKKTARGKTPAYAELGFRDNESIWAARNEGGSRTGFWVLEAGASQWRRVATQLTRGEHPAFTANDGYVSFLQELEDGTTEVLAFSLHEANAMPVSLFPKPLTAEIKVDEALPSGLLVERFTALEPFEGALWWIRASATGLGTPKMLSDVRAATEPRLQPQP